MKAIYFIGRVIKKIILIPFVALFLIGLLGMFLANRNGTKALLLSMGMDIKHK